MSKPLVLALLALPCAAMAQDGRLNAGFRPHVTTEVDVGF